MNIPITSVLSVRLLGAETQSDAQSKGLSATLYSYSVQLPCIATARLSRGRHEKGSFHPHASPNTTLDPFEAGVLK